MTSSNTTFTTIIRETGRTPDGIIAIAIVLVLLTTNAWCFSIGSFSDALPLRRADELNHIHWNNLAVTPTLFQRQRRKKFTTILLSSSNNNYGPDTSNSEGEAMSKKSLARTGGRKRRVVKSESNNKETNNTIATVLIQWAVPLIVVALFFRFLFGILFPSTNTNYVYYSRSVYQTTTYSRNGKVETKRKETFQSNIPGLVEESRDQSMSRQNVESTIDDEILDLEEEIFNAFNIRGW